MQKKENNKKRKEELVKKSKEKKVVSYLTYLLLDGPLLSFITESFEQMFKILIPKEVSTD